MELKTKDIQILERLIVKTISKMYRKTGLQPSVLDITYDELASMIKEQRETSKRKEIKIEILE